jgi:hypothetical protein
MAMGQSRPVKAIHVDSGRMAVRVEMEELIPPKVSFSKMTTTFVTIVLVTE